MTTASVDSGEWDNVLIAAIKGGCRKELLEKAIFMGANVKNRLKYSTLLCLEEMDAYECEEHNYMAATILLLEAGLCMDYRREAAEYANKSRLSL